MLKPVDLAVLVAYLTAVVGLPIVVGAIYVGGWTFAIAAGAVATLAAAEFVHGWLFPSQPLRAVLPLAFGIGAAGVMVAGAHPDERFVAAGVILAAMFLIAGYLRTNAFGPRKP